MAQHPQREDAAPAKRPIPASLSFVSDFNCPYCFLGFRRMQKVLATLKDQLDVYEFRFVPYKLMRDTTGKESKVASYRKLLGPARYADMLKNLAAMGKPDGIEFNFSEDARLCTSTTDAHRLLAFAPEDKKLALADELFKAYHTRGLDLGDPNTLVDCALRAGAATEEAPVRAFLESGALKSETIAQMKRAMSDNAGMGVPQFIFHLVTDKPSGPAMLRFQGAQEESYFKILLTRSLSKL